MFGMQAILIQPVYPPCRHFAATQHFINRINELQHFHEGFFTCIRCKVT